MMCPSGTGRFIADSWFSDEPLPAAYTHPAAARLRQSGGVSAARTRSRGSRSVSARRWTSPRAIAGMRQEAARLRELREPYLAGMAVSLEAMWDLAMEVLGKGDPVPYARAVEASTAKPPEPSRPRSQARTRCRIAGPRRILAAQSGGILEAVDAWRRERVTPMASVRALGAAVIAHFDALSAQRIWFRIFRQELARVPRANIDFLPIKDAWFSGSMNYIGRARNADGTPQYEASYEINASLQISYPEFEQLVSHEVVPGHVTTFAYLQDLVCARKRRASRPRSSP